MLAGQWGGAIMRKTFHQAVSLGISCQVIYQLRRHLGDEFCSSGVFDMQVTPPSALIEYLQRDFRGMFERDDLVEENGIVFNQRFLTEHLHEFPNGLERSYEDARSRHDYLSKASVGDRRPHADAVRATSLPIGHRPRPTRPIYSARAEPAAAVRNSYGSDRLKTNASAPK